MFITAHSLFKKNIVTYKFSKQICKRNYDSIEIGSPKTIVVYSFDCQNNKALNRNFEGYKTSLKTCHIILQFTHILLN